MNKSTTTTLFDRLSTRGYQQETHSSYSRHSRLLTLPKEDINEIIDISEINKDQEFLKYIKQKNIDIAKGQIEAIEQLLKFVKNSYPFLY